MHLHPRQRVERAERLVQQQQPGPADQGAGQRHALALAARQHGRPVAGAVGEADIGQRPRRRCRQPAPRAMPTLSSTALPGQQARVLEQHPHARRQARERPAVEQDVARRSAVSRPASRRSSVLLPQPRAPDHGDELARLDGEIEPFQHRPVAEALGDAVAGRRRGRAPRVDGQRRCRATAVAVRGRSISASAALMRGLRGLVGRVPGEAAPLELRASACRRACPAGRRS